MKTIKFNLYLLITLLAFCGKVSAAEGFDNPNAGTTEPEKLPRNTLLVELSIDMYQIDHTLYFNPDYVGSQFDLEVNGRVIYTGIIDEEGIVTLPDYFVGDFDVILDFYGCILTSSITL